MILGWRNGCGLLRLLLGLGVRFIGRLVLLMILTVLCGRSLRVLILRVGVLMLLTVLVRCVMIVVNWLSVLRLVVVGLMLVVFVSVEVVLGAVCECVGVDAVVVEGISVRDCAD